MTDQPDIREQVAAFLAGDLDEGAAEAMQNRIDTEPWVARLADETADMLVALGRVEEVPLPDGFSDRLFAGLEAELGRPLADPLPDRRAFTASGAAAATGWAEQTRPRRRHDPARPSSGRDRSRRTRLQSALAVAAVLAVLAVAGVGVLSQSGMFGSGDDTALERADDSADAAFQDADTAAMTAEELAAEDARTESDAAAAMAATEGDAEPAAAADEDAVAADDDAAGDTADSDSTAEEEAAEAGGSDETIAAPVDGPAVLTLGEVADDDATLARVAGEHPAAQALLGTDAADIAELAAAYRDELLRGPDFEDGTPAGACLTDTLDAAGQDLVPAVAAKMDLPDGPAVAYALVRSRSGETLDAVEVWVLDLPGCGVDRVISQG